MNAPKKQQGGKRPGAGRKKGYRKPNPRQRINAFVTPETLSKLKSENLSLGKAIDKAVEKAYCSLWIVTVATLITLILMNP